MTARALAKTYLRYWYKDPQTSTWNMSDNAPVPLAACIRSLPATVNRNMAYEALNIIAGNAAFERPLDMLLVWLQANKQLVPVCDAALKSKRPPGTLRELVEKAYVTEMQTARNHITTCLDAALLI